MLRGWSSYFSYGTRAAAYRAVRPFRTSSQVPVLPGTSQDPLEVAGVGTPQQRAVLARPSALRAGRQVLAKKCVQCHDLRTILSRPGFLASAGQLVWNRFTGPERVGIQSMYLHMRTAE